jgi:hypothetical protein
MSNNAAYAAAQSLQRANLDTQNGLSTPAPSTKFSATSIKGRDIN